MRKSSQPYKFMSFKGPKNVALNSAVILLALFLFSGVKSAIKGKKSKNFCSCSGQNDSTRVLNMGTMAAPLKAFTAPANEVTSVTTQRPVSLFAATNLG